MLGKNLQFRGIVNLFQNTSGNKTNKMNIEKYLRQNNNIDVQSKKY